MHVPKAISYPNFAQLGCHHERGHAIIVEYILQVAVWVGFGTFDEQQVVHLSDETCVVPSVVSDMDQGVQDCVSPRVLPPQICRLVAILGQIMHHVWLVGTSCK